MIAKLEIGLRWEHLEAISSGVRDHEIEIQPGWSEVYPDSQYFVLKCDCGNEIEVWGKDWKGKRALKDCGCGLSALDQVKAVKCISLPLVVWQKLKAYANKKGLTASKAISDLIMKGVE